MIAAQRWTMWFACAACAVACVPSIEMPPRAVVECEAKSECPGATICAALAEGGGRCVSPDSPCVDDDDAAVPDGSPCGDLGVCVSGACGPRSCGDGLVDRPAGEACDPLHDRGCRADCTLAVCGDERLDFGEACDDRSIACVACAFTCSAETFADSETPWANCDLQADNGCECVADELPGTALPQFYVARFLSPARVFVQLGTDDGSIRNFIFDLNEDTSLALPSSYYDVVGNETDPTRGYAIVIDAGEPHIAEIDVGTGDVVDRRAARLPDSGYLAVAGDRFFVSASDAVLAGDVATGEVSGSLDACDFEQFISVCGGEVVCSNRNAVLLAIDIDTAEFRELDRSPEAGRVLSFACVDERIVWRDVERLFVDGAGGPVLLRSFPASFGGVRGATLAATDDPGRLLVGLDIGGVTGPYTYAYDVAADTIVGLLPGQPRASGGDRVVTSGSLQAAGMLVGPAR